MASGWAEEEVDHPDSGEKSRLYNACIAWKSVQAHVAYRNSQTFKDNIHLLRGAKDLRGAKVWHVSTKEVLKQ
jgi:hypothetical protein